MKQVERGYFGPSESFLALTEKFINAIIERFNQMGMSVEIRRHPAGHVQFIVADEVYIHTNDGVEATIKFVGFKQ